MLQKRILPSTALDFVKAFLEDGITLSELLLSGTNLEQGKVWTYLPSNSNISNERLLNLNYGGLKYYLTSEDEANLSDISNIPAAVTTYIQGFLEQKSSNVCIFENYSASPLFPYIQNRKSDPYLFLEEEVYTFVNYDTATPVNIELAIKDAKTHKLTGALSSLPQKLNLHPQEQITINVLENVTSYVKALIFTAYDAESYIIWETT